MPRSRMLSAFWITVVMMREPPEAPRKAKSVPLANSAMRGAMDDRGRFLGRT